MQYSNPATADNPAHVIFLIDVSDSMTVISHGQTRLEIVYAALNDVISEMIELSRVIIAPNKDVVYARFKIAIVLYREEAVDAFPGFRDVKHIDAHADSRGLHLPIPAPDRPRGKMTNMYSAFQKASELLDSVYPTLTSDSPAPLVCHLTDGFSTSGENPELLVAKMRRHETPDGPVLIENVFVAESALRQSIDDTRTWTGIRSELDLDNDTVDGKYARALFHMSSTIPPTYLEAMRRRLPGILPGARLLFPGTRREFITRALALTGSSGNLAHGAFEDR